MSAAAAASPAPARPAPATRELVIDACKPIKSGVRKDGKGQWTIYEVQASTPQGGARVGARLRSWDLLPIGEPARTYEIQRDVFTKDDGSELVSYFLRIPKPSVSEMRELLDGVYVRLEDFDRRLQALEAPEPATSQPSLTDAEVPF